MAKPNVSSASARYHRRVHTKKYWGSVNPLPTRFPPLSLLKHFVTMRFSLILLFLIAAAPSFAQDPADIFHKTVDLDEINEVSLDVYANDYLEIRQWPGDDILIETSVKLNNGEPHILKFFLERGRWDLKEEITGDQLQLVSGDKVRRMVQGTEGTSSETVNIVVYMPEEFSQAGENLYRRASR
jgi:hypothetical protein